jgi:hypothetical protein
MRVIFERFGGFAGLRLHSSWDVDSLPEEEARRLKALLIQSRFFELPGDLVSPRGQPDRFTYRLTVESDQGSRTMEAAESAMPLEMRPLLEWLNRNSPRRS